jgi:putative transposase
LKKQERQDMLSPGHESLSLVKQCELLGLNRSSTYYRPRPVNENDMKLMLLIDEQFLKTPFYGSRRMAVHLRQNGHAVNRKRAQRLMGMMGISAIYPGPRTSTPHPDHKVFPYLLRNMVIDHPNQVWSTDITYLPMARGFMYLVAIMDWHSRKVLSWKVSNTLDTRFCLEALEEAFENHGKPEIFNTDQGSQFTSTDFIKTLQSRGVQISMDGRGRCHDNIFIERLWRSVKRECLYLHAFENGVALRRGLGEWFDWYNRKRPHQSLGYCTPDEVYQQGVMLKEAA